MRSIAEIDRDITLNMRLLRRLAERSFSYRLQTFIHYGEAREAYPILDAVDEDLYRERGEAQRIRDAAEHDRAMRTARAANRVARKTYQAKRCPQCGAVA